LQERDSANNIVLEYTWGANKGGGIGGLLMMRQNGQNYYHLYDGKGNVSAVLNSSQSIVASYRYDTFGRVIVKSGTLNQPYQFSTKRYLADVGLNYYGYRFYSSSIGAWINRDPIGEEGGINLYAFVMNNPVNLIDQYGLRSTCQRVCDLIVLTICAISGGLLGMISVIGGVIWAIYCGFMTNEICDMECEYREELCPKSEGGINP
jgi:RHS repeat-associated protein